MFLKAFYSRVQGVIQPSIKECCEGRGEARGPAFFFFTLFFFCSIKILSFFHVQNMRRRVGVESTKRGPLQKEFGVTVVIGLRRSDGSKVVLKN